jgi:PAS domain S-box-containing protein
MFANRIEAAATTNQADPYSYEAIAKKDYRGVTLNVVTLEKPVLGEPTELHARQFEKLTGAKINITFVPFDEFYQEVLLGLRQKKYDVLFYGSMWIADVLQYLEPIPEKMLKSSQYRDVLPHYKNIASWGDVAYQVPIDGDRHYLQYRKDLLEHPMLLVQGKCFVDCNEAALKMLDVSSFEKLRNMTIGDLSPQIQPDGRLSDEVIQENMAALLERGSLHFEWYHQRANGELFPVAVSLTLMSMASEPITHVLWQDISERKQAEKELQEYRQHLEKMVEERTQELSALNKELEAFSYSVSHDLRAPLRGIDGFSQALFEDYSDQIDDTGKDYLQRVRRGVQKMGALIDDLLEFSRVTRGELNKEAVNLSVIAQDVLRELQEGDSERTVQVSITPKLSAQGDQRLLRVVLVNLLGNAWKYTSTQREACIEFGARNDGNKTTYFVRDNGVGFDMKYADKLLGVFQRLHRVDEFPGIGIGLATVSRIVYRHGGKVWAESELNKGATFYFTLS